MSVSGHDLLSYLEYDVISLGSTSSEGDDLEDKMTAFTSCGDSEDEDGFCMVEPPSCFDPCVPLEQSLIEMKLMNKLAKAADDNVSNQTLSDTASRDRQSDGK